jgi:peptidyl-prolyl cis-trans isomerase D
MSLINKIRERSGWAVGIVAASLLLFIVGGDLLSGNSQIFGNSSQEVGKIDGQPIDYRDFTAKVDALRGEFQQQSGRAPSEQDMPQLREQAWQELIFGIAYQKEFDKLGLSVSPDELVDMVQGNNISPAVRQAFTDPKTGVFDKNMIVNYLKGLRNLPAQQQQSWANFEAKLSQDRLREKYENLMRLSVFVTSAEAKREYEAQNTKVDVKFLFVPYYTINDTTVKVTDSQLQDYLNRHKAEFPGGNSRSMQYVTFSVTPSKEDSAQLYSQIKTLARGLGAATNDSSFAQINSDVRTPLYQTIGEMPEQLRASVSSFAPGGIYGPFRDGNTYFIYKFGGTKRDTSFTARASHILIRPTTPTDSSKAEARRKAEGLLKQIQGGANFEALAQANSADGSKQLGGDLGFFKNTGQMVKPFESAVFGQATAGLIPRIIETDFGFHIIKVTEAKSNLLYRVSAIGKTIAASEATRNEAFQKASAFSSAARTKEAFDKQAKGDKNLLVATAERVGETADNVNALTGAREVVRWAFNDKTDIGDVSEPYEVGDQYVIAVLTGKTNKDNVTVADYKQELTAKVRNEEKAKQIIAKLGNANGPLEGIAQKYGAGALVETATDVNMATGFLRSAGVDAVALGKVFGTKPGQRSKPFAGETGVLVVEPIATLPAPNITDYSPYRTLIQQNVASRTGFYMNEVIKDAAKVEDRRSKFF